jgi:septum formation protein
VDRAGAYAIQGLASRFIPRIEGSYSNVVGLPVAVVSSILMKG